MHAVGLSQTLARVRTNTIAFLAPTRLWDWWEFKVPVFLGVAYLAAVGADITFETLWPRLIVIVAALVPVASYVCVINDITDRRDDRLAGKPNCMLSRSPLEQASWVIACIMGGVLSLMVLRGSQFAFWLYAANWLAFTLYSLPPVRLKNRGVWGVMADACGGQLLPTLWTVSFVAHAPTTKLPPGLVVSLGVWAFALGCRGILGHQLRDLQADRSAGVRTLAVQIGPERSRWALCCVLLPIEMAAFSIAAVLGGAWPALIALAATAGIPWARGRLGPQSPRAVDAASFAFPYYITLFPVVGALQLAAPDIGALSLVPLHVIAFPGCWGLSLARFASPADGARSPPAGADTPLPDGTVSIVIPAYQGRRTITACLESLTTQRGIGRSEIIVVESSGDGSADIIERSFPSTTVVRAPERLSAGAARNWGASLARGRFILFIDQDCIAPRDWVARLVHLLRHPGVEAAGGSIGIANPSNLSGAAVYFIEFLHHFPHRGGPRPDAPFLLGCNAGYRAEVLQAVQFPDQTLAEDVLFTHRVRTAGYGVAYDPEITVLHHNRSGWGEFFAYAKKMGRASAEYHASIDRPWIRPFLHWPILIFPASLLVSPLIGLRLLRSPWKYLGIFMLVAPVCVLGNLAWAAAFRRRIMEKRSAARLYLRRDHDAERL